MRRGAGGGRRGQRHAWSVLISIGGGGGGSQTHAENQFDQEADTAGMRYASTLHLVSIATPQSAMTTVGKLTNEIIEQNILPQQTSPTVFTLVRGIVEQMMLPQPTSRTAMLPAHPCPSTTTTASLAPSLSPPNDHPRRWGHVPSGGWASAWTFLACWWFSWLSWWPCWRGERPLAW